MFYVPSVLVHHIIPDKRLSMKYIRGLADGVAKSEIKRIRKDGGTAGIKKVVDEGIKIVGTLILAFLYYLRIEFEKGNMLIKFRYWVLRGYFI